MDDLTFVCIYFAKIFCQNSVKKNCKFVLQFSLEPPSEYCLSHDDINSARQ